MAGFQDIIGHKQIIEHLKTAIRMEKVSHAYIISGPDLSGKRMIADAFARALQCENHDPEGCGICRSCRQAEDYNQPDIIYVQHEKPYIISVDDIREQVNNSIVIKPYSSRYKIYIIDEAEKMNQQAQNALLKTIEEPPAYGVLLLLTTNADSFLPTILSRCITLDIRTVKDEVIRDYLMKKHGIPDYQADVCSAFAQGNVGKAVKLASSEDFNEMKSHAVSVLKRMESTQEYELGDLVKQIAEYKLQISDYLDLMTMWFRDVLYLKASGSTDRLIFKDEIFDMKKQAERHSYHGLETILRAIETAGMRLGANVNFDLSLELLLLCIKEN